MRNRRLGTSYSDPEILCLYKQVEKHAVILCQTEELHMHMPRIDFRTRGTNCRFYWIKNTAYERYLIFIGHKS